LFLKRGSLYTIFLLCILLISTFSLLGGKGKSDKEKRELRFWHSIGTYNKDVLNSLIENYNDHNRQVLIKGVFQGSDKDLYLKLISPETRPDIVQISVQFLPALVEKNELVDLTSSIPSKLKEDIEDKFWSSVSYRDRIYGIPFLYSVNLLFVNQHILRIAGVRRDTTPASWPEILSISEKIKDNLGDKWPLFIPMESMMHFLSFVQSYTGEPAIRDGKILINTDKSIDAMQFLRDLVFKERTMPAKLSIDEGENLFLSGNLGIIAASSSLLVYTESNLPYDMNVWYLPSSAATLPFITGSCLAILKSSPREKRESIRFIEYLTDYENAIKWHTHTGNPAIRKSVKSSLDLIVFYEDNPNHMASINEIERGLIFNPSSGYLEVSEVLGKALEAIMLKGEDPAIILNSAQKELDDLNLQF